MILNLREEIRYLFRQRFHHRLIACLVRLSPFVGEHLSGVHPLVDLAFVEAFFRFEGIRCDMCEPSVPLHCSIGHNLEDLRIFEHGIGLIGQGLHLFLALLQNGILVFPPLLHNLQQVIHLTGVFHERMAFFGIVVEHAESLREEAVDVRTPLVLQLSQQFAHHHLELLVVVGQLADILFDGHLEEVGQPDLHRIVHAEIEVEGGGADHALDKAVNSGNAELRVVVQDTVQQ